MNNELENFADKSQFVKSLFENIAQDYDKLNDIMSFGLHRNIKKNIIRTIKQFSCTPLTCLDLCTGTGDIAALLKKSFPDTNVIGLDFSDKMLEIAKQKHPKIEFLKADCTKLPFEDKSIDLCTISFGLRNINFVTPPNQTNNTQCRLGFPTQQHGLQHDLAAHNHENLEKVIKEIYRVLKPDGIFINLDLGKPNPFFNLFLKPYMYIWVAILGKIFHGDAGPYKYLAHSNESFPSPEKLMEIYKKTGFKEVKNKNYLFGQIASQQCLKS